MTAVRKQDINTRPQSFRLSLLIFYFNFAAPLFGLHFLRCHTHSGSMQGGVNRLRFLFVARTFVIPVMCLACAGPCGEQSVLEIILNPGTYVLVVEGYQRAAGEYQVHMACSLLSSGATAVVETDGGCRCLQTWAVSSETCRDGDTAYHGCHFPPCDGDNGGNAGHSWCMIESGNGCSPEGTNWDYCVPSSNDHGDNSAVDNGDTCSWRNDGECDEPHLCMAGTDTTDCSDPSNPTYGDAGVHS